MQNRYQFRYRKTFFNSKMWVQQHALYLYSPRYADFVALMAYMWNHWDNQLLQTLQNLFPH